MQINKKVYTTFIIAMLTVSMVLMALPAVFALVTVTFPFGNTGSPGAFSRVSGSSTTTGGLMEVYWDTVKAWDGTAGKIAEGYASGTTYTINFFVPEAVYGAHDVIVKDVEAPETAAGVFNVVPMIALDPDVGLAADTITVIGKGFNPSEYITMYYWDGAAYQTLTTSPLMPQTSPLGSFTCTFVIPADAENLADNIQAEDESLAMGEATLDIGPYITVDPEEGLTDSTVTVSGRGFTASGTVDIEWLIGGSFITVVSDAAITAAGSFTVSFAVPLLPDPVAPGTDYTIRATDSGTPTPIVDTVIFTLIELPSIKLTPPAGKIATALLVEGTWFAPGRPITVTFDGQQVATTTSDAVDGSWDVTFAVPELPVGQYVVEASDDRGNSDTATFTIVVDVFMVETRATQYMRGDTLSLKSQATVARDVELEITDPNGLIFYENYVDASWWQFIPPYNQIPYTMQYLPYWPIPSDAPLGWWNFTCYDDATGAILDSNLFEVVARPTQQDVLDEVAELGTNMTDILAEMKAQIEGVITTTEGDIIAVINTKTGPITTKLDALSPKLQGIEDTVVIIATMLGEVQVDIAALDLDALGVDITAIKGDVATIKTSIGTVTASVSALDAKVTSLSGNVATVSTSLGTLEGTVSSIEGTVATIDTDVGAIQADVSDILDKPDVDMTPVWIAVVLSLIAAIAAIFAVVTIRQKIAG